MSNDNQKPAEIAVRHLYFKDNCDFQGQSQQSNLKCYPQPANQPNYYTAEFLPGWRMFKISWHRNGVEPEVRYMPAEYVRTWSRFDDKGIAEITKTREGNWR